ncbi:MAG TPA: hypothetical protein VE325_04350 [Burkholderiales bacterium]|nr:hypothetical protein [Burkholderiales bacterium]
MRPALKVAAIFVVCAAPLALGWLASEERWISGSSGNYGELLSPQQLAGALAPLRGKWVLVTLDPAACEARCERKLYIVRQVRRAQGKNAERVVRLWLLSDGGTPRAQLVAALDGGHIARADATLASALAGEYIYLVDPLGNLMMRFPAEPQAKRMIQDLERLLKYSSFG